ncbi:hypothetical protein GUITHDRAFT_116383 [Guillardia theta CCMP2712]|uniref:Uncharacterized protein n=1 Tax=Guillardia theta (strain CCMP2712) TaxID=905079 RepID=L1IMV5_GUITC|nr:hypothetical protein GUITHDRAFT_116383 [Guillardia theta CCMP2712]EKX37422.1 hypothetical protein GUITHDRAFT_116383 [Guillardia theta CCMP2712]|eukprot:XP_005824402.1 hypothetical protein GUITHDRAFT_116383 [Guillardia theta CCMP2712]
MRPVLVLSGMSRRMQRSEKRIRGCMREAEDVPISFTHDLRADTKELLTDLCCRLSLIPRQPTMPVKQPRSCGLWKFLMVVWLAAVWPEGVRSMQTFAFMSAVHNPKMMQSLRHSSRTCKLFSGSTGRHEDGQRRTRNLSLFMRNSGGGKDFLQEAQAQIASLTRSLQQFLSNGTGLIFPAVFVLLLVTGQVALQEGDVKENVAHGSEKAVPFLEREEGGEDQDRMPRLVEILIKWVFDIFNFIFLLTSVVDGECPNCGSRVMLAKKSQSLCMTCGTPLLVENGKVSRVSVYNTRTDTRTGKQTVVDVVDVEAIDVDSKEK